jgi:tyramine---L-glutamate ligase
VRVFAFEYFCGGGLNANSDATERNCMAAEGKAMLGTLIKDLQCVSDWHVSTLWDPTLGPFPWNSASETLLDKATGQMDAFRRCVAESDAVVAIAPETHGVLGQFCRAAETTGTRFVGPSSETIELFSDKLSTAKTLLELQQRPTDSTVGGPLTIETALFVPGVTKPEFAYPIVLKPRDGAGTQDTWMIRNAFEWSDAVREVQPAMVRQEFIQQPFVTGHSVSTAAIVDRDRGSFDVFPVGEQSISIDRVLEYRGGRLPGNLAPSIEESIRSIVEYVCRNVPGLSGYVGFDLVIPNDAPHHPLIVDVNPRLTTAYLGYSVLAEDNLAARMIGAGSADAPIRWKNSTVTFTSEGDVAVAS